MNHLVALLCVSLCLITSVVSLEKRSSSLPASDNTEEDNFQTVLAQSLSQVDTLLGPVLIHTADDLITFVNGNQTRNVTISATVYQNLKVVSHLPVTAVSLLLSELINSGGPLSNNQLTSNTRNTLQDFQQRTQNLSSLNSTASLPTDEQNVRQQEIIGRVLYLLTEVLNGSATVSLEYLTRFTVSLSGYLRANSHDAVLDYLTCLNESLWSLNVPQDILTQQLVVVLPVGPFSQAGSFLHQYYEQLLNIKPGSQRLVSRPAANCSTLSDKPLLFSTTLYQAISNVFYSDSFVSVHNDLSQAAAEIICSSDLQLPSCARESTVEGFHTRLEKSYVVIMMIFGGCAVLAGIVLGCIAYENQLMTCEMKTDATQHKLKLNGPNLFTPVASLQEDSLLDSSQYTTETRSSLLSRSDSNT